MNTMKKAMPINLTIKFKCKNFIKDRNDQNWDNKKTKSKEPIV